jgi:hypothetical protein
MCRIGLLDKCPYCDERGKLYTSRPESWHDEVCLFFFLQIVMCHSCMRRHRPLFLRPVPLAPEKKPEHPRVNDKKPNRSA